MLLDDLGLGFLAALIIVAPITLVTAIGTRTKRLEWTLLTAAAVIFCYGIFNCLWFWLGSPVIGFSSIAINHEYWLVFWAALIAFVAIAATAYDYEGDNGIPTVGSFVVAAGLLFSMCYGISQQFLWNGHDAKTLAAQVHVYSEPNNLYPNTDPNHILQVPEQTADFYANQVLGSSRKLSTVYNVGDGVLQSVNHHLYWVYGLKPTGFRASNAYQDGVPAMVVVDAENPDAHPILRTKDANGNSYHMRNIIGGYHAHSIKRYLWTHGYRAQVVEDLTLEVDDSWRPYYTADVRVPTTNFNNDVPGKALIIDPQTGSIKTYPIGNSLPGNKPVALPGWVDRIYSAEDVTRMLNWWGEWSQANWSLFSESPTNRYKVAGDPVLVYTTGGHPVWQAIMTSYSKDTSAAYLALFDARDNEARLYSIPGLTQSSVAEHVILGSGKNNKNPPLQPVHMTLHKIYGQLTWVAPLIRGTSADSTDTSPVNGSAQQGIALLPYNETNGDNVVIATGMSAALTQYRGLLANPNASSGVESNSNNKTAEGVVSNLSQVVEGGQTVFYFTLGSDKTHVYRAVEQSAGSDTQNLELPFIKVGAKVTVTYLDIGSTRRDIGSYNDHSLAAVHSG